VLERSLIVQKIVAHIRNHRLSKLRGRAKLPTTTVVVATVVILAGLIIGQIASQMGKFRDMLQSINVLPKTSLCNDAYRIDMGRTSGMRRVYVTNWEVRPKYDKNEKN
jgi:hypothetical protein